MKSLRWLALAVVVILMTATACQRTDDSRSANAATQVADSAPAEAAASANGSSSDSEDTATVSSATDRSSSGLALTGEDLSLPPARGIDELASASAATEPAPATISIERLELTETPVRAVGVESNGEMTVPAPLDVGWYRYGPIPGEAGSAVLAGHIASGGIPGAFRHLDRLEPGDLVTIGFDDGSSQTWVVDELVQVDKTDLPFDSIFARSGPSKIALITCGGEFDHGARSYEDNIVVTASPVTG